MTTQSKQEDELPVLGYFYRSHETGEIIEHYRRDELTDDEAASFDGYVAASDAQAAITKREAETKAWQEAFYKSTDQMAKMREALKEAREVLGEASWYITDGSELDVRACALAKRLTELTAALAQSADSGSGAVPAPKSDNAPPVDA